MARNRERIEIEIFREDVSDEKKWVVVIWYLHVNWDGGENGSGTQTYPRFKHRRTAKWVAERMFAAYEMDGWDVRWRKRDR